ncbi:helix-turn-helix domain-containing protein [Enterococcus sp. LJL128]
MEIHEQIKEKRKELGLTQQEVADKVFVTRQTISKWELGKSRPDLVSLKLLGEQLQTDFLKNDSKEKGKQGMKITWKDILMTAVFGIFFLPVRLLITYLKPKVTQPIVKYALLPFVITAGVLYMRSLNETAFFAVGGMLICLYYPIAGYYFKGTKES